jgi:hypothetical protein
MKYAETPGRWHLWDRGATIPLFVWPFVPGSGISGDPIRFEALVDTGSTHSFMPFWLVNQINMMPVSEVDFHRIDRVEDAIAYRTMISFREDVKPFERPVLAIHGRPTITMADNVFLIGRDILTISRLEYDGIRGEYRIEIDSSMA